MKALGGIALAFLSLISVAAFADAARDESGPALDPRAIERDDVAADRSSDACSVADEGAQKPCAEPPTAARGRQEALATEHRKLYEEWLLESRKRAHELARDGRSPTLQGLRPIEAWPTT